MSFDGSYSSEQGIRVRLPVAGHPPYNVFWSHTEEGVRVEAVFPRP